MAGTPTKLFAKKAKPSGEVGNTLFRKRKAARGVVWTDVDLALLAQLLTHCIAENIGIGFYSASGGRGVCFKLYTGKKLPDIEYAATADEMNELIAGVLDMLGESLDDSAEAEAAD